MRSEGIRFFDIRAFSIAALLLLLRLVDIADDLKAPVLGLYGGKDQGVPLASVERMREALARAREFIAYVELEPHLSERADSLSLQQKKALEFARALASEPKLLLVDEVASGLTPIEINRFVRHIRHVRDEFGITVIWVEHIFSALTQVVDRLIVLDTGRLVADGPLAEVLKDESKQ